MAIDTNPEKIKEILNRGVEQVIDKSHLETALKSGKKLRVYYGIDPTSPVIHLGHSIVLWKLKAFQDLGHEVIFLIGDFTARIGDPTDKEATRQPLTEKQIKENMKNYKEQASKILDFSKVKMVFNSKWLSKLNFEKIVDLASHLSALRMLERDMFKKRMQEGKTISLHEFLYPLMQGYDSVALNVDLEIAGNDQLFNMLVGRELQKIYNKKDKDVLTTKLLLGTDGRKMSKTFGNTISITAEPNDMFCNVMSICDELIVDYFELCTQTPMSEVAKIKQDLQSQTANPMDLKNRLAKEIVKQFYGSEISEEAEKYFNNIFSERSVLMPGKNIFKTTNKTYPILDLIWDMSECFEWNLSKSEVKRLIIGGAVKKFSIIEEAKLSPQFPLVEQKYITDEERVTDWKLQLELKDGLVIQVGKPKGEPEKIKIAQIKLK